MGKVYSAARRPADPEDAMRPRRWATSRQFRISRCQICGTAASSSSKRASARSDSRFVVSSSSHAPATDASSMNNAHVRWPRCRASRRSSIDMPPDCHSPRRRRKSATACFRLVRSTSGAGVICATVRPWRVIATVSPRSTVRSNSANRAFASVAGTALMRNTPTSHYDHITIIADRPFPQGPADAMPHIAGAEYADCLQGRMLHPALPSRSPLRQG